MVRLFTTDHGFILESIVKFTFYIIRTFTVKIEMYVWLCMAMPGYVWLCRAVYGYVGLCMAM